MLVATGLLKPLGPPPRNGTKFFATEILDQLRRDEKWLARASDAICNHAIIPINIFGPQVGDVRLRPTEVPAELVKIAQFGIPLSSDDQAVFPDGDGALVEAPFAMTRQVVRELGLHSYDRPGGQRGDDAERQIYQQQVEREHWPSLPKPEKPRAAHRQKDQKQRQHRSQEV